MARSHPVTRTLMKHDVPITHTALIVLFSIGMTACDPPARGSHAPILLFTGIGTSDGDVAAVERVLEHNHLAYATATSPQLNRMSASELMAYRMIIVPGGNFIDMNASLTPRTTARIRGAVQGGVSRRNARHRRRELWPGMVDSRRRSS